MCPCRCVAREEEDDENEKPASTMKRTSTTTRSTTMVPTTITGGRALLQRRVLAIDMVAIGNRPNNHLAKRMAIAPLLHARPRRRRRLLLVYVSQLPRQLRRRKR